MKTNSQKNCPVCLNPSGKFTEKSGYVVYKCINCGFGFTENPNPQKGDYHRDDTYKLEEKLFSNIFQRRVNEIYKFIKSGKILEIGSSTGLMLMIFKQKGFEVKGVEISRKAAEISKSKGLDIIIGSFEKIKFDEKFDLVILNHTLEHMENPPEVLEKVKRILKPKGYLMIDLPNFDSPVAQLLKSKWPHLLPDEHLWHFTQKAFEILLKKKDFKIKVVKKASGVWDFGNPFLELRQSLFGFKKRFFTDITTLVPSWIFTKLNNGSDLLVIARKK